MKVAYKIPNNLTHKSLRSYLSRSTNWVIGCGEIMCASCILGVVSAVRPRPARCCSINVGDKLPQEVLERLILAKLITKAEALDLLLEEL